jgi:hypothetical protein
MLAQAMKYDVEKYIAKCKRTDKVFAKGFEAGFGKMKAKLFQELLASVKQARAIERGELKPSRVFKVKAKRGAAPNARTVRTLKASKTGRKVKRFGSKRALLADLGM